VTSLTATGLYQRFGGRELFNGLSFSLPAGTITVIKGPNGSGKSTLLLVAAHLLRPDAGDVTLAIDGAAVSAACHRAHVAMAAPEMNLYPRLSALENLRFFAGLRDKKLSSTDEASLLSRVGLLPKDAARSLGELSTGMKWRVKLAIMIASDTDLWLLDEPGANLDDAGRMIMSEEINMARSSGKIVLVATNDAKEEGAANAVIRLGESPACIFEGDCKRQP